MQQNSLLFFQPENQMKNNQNSLLSFQPSDAFSQRRTRPIQGDLTLGNIASYFLPFSKDIPPYQDSPRLGTSGGINIDFPPIAKDIFTGTVSGINKFGQAMRGELSPQEIQKLAFDTSMNVAGGGIIGSKIIPNAVPSGSLGVFAGKSATNFPAKSLLEKPNPNKLKNLYNDLMATNYELSKGRLSLGDEITDNMQKRQKQLREEIALEQDKLFKQKDNQVKLLDEFMEKQDLRSGIIDDVSRFRGSEREFGTGLFKLPDNQYRFEIDDRPANIKLNIADDADALFSEITSDAFERVLPRTDMGVTKQLDQFLDHDELFKAYPQLRKYPVKIKFDTKDSARGSFNPRSNQITINLADMRPFFEGKSITGKKLKKDIKSTLMHEIQHAIQEIEGFARGSSPYVSNADDAIMTAVRQRQDIILKNQAGHNAYNASRADLVNLGGAERIKYYEQKSLLDSHQPRLLFNQTNWYKYGDEIRREVSQELGYAYKKRKSPEREKWISRAFAKLAEKERKEMPTSSRIADTLSMKEIKSQYGKASRIADKNYKSFADYRNARTSLDQIQNDYRYASGNPQKEMNIYRDSLGEAEARAVQARAEPADNNRFFRSTFPPNQFQEGSMESPPPFGLRNTLRQQGGFFKD